MAISFGAGRKGSPTLDKVLEEVETLKEARTLLEQVYLDIGPYQGGELKDDTWSRVRDFFGFDDGE